MALIDYSPARKRELLYTMNGKPVYRDELRPIGQLPKMVIPWKEIFYVACLVAGSLWAGYL